MACDSPQMLIESGVVDCGLCLSCCKAKREADRARRLFWLRRRSGRPLDAGERAFFDMKGGERNV